MYVKRNNGRQSFRSGKRPYKKSNSVYSNKNRSRGSISQLFEKYNKLGKEASSYGDRIQSEYYYQFADHYSRLMVELGIKNNEVENSFQEEENKTNSDEKGLADEQKNNDINSSENESDVSDIDEEDTDSLQSVPFISEPVKKKSTKSRKESN